MYAKARWPAPGLWWPAIGPIYMRETDVEIARDITLPNGLADKSPSLEGMKLSRFDKILGLTRERIARIYRGEMIGRLALE